MVASRKETLWIILLILVFNLAPALNIETGDAQTTIRLSLNPPETKNSALGIGSTFKIDLNITDVIEENAPNGLFGWQVNMTFNPAVVNVTLVLEGPFLKDDWGFPTIWPEPVVDNTKGWVFASCSIAPPYPDTGAYYDGILAYITFMVKAEGRGTLLEFVSEGTYLRAVIGGAVVAINNFTTEDGSFDNRPIGQNAVPEAIFDVKPLNASKRGEVNFDASNSSDPDAWLVSYRWDYGDGATEVYMRTPQRNINLTARATHVFNQSDTYTVTLNVTDNDGETNITSSQVTVLYDIAVVNVESPYRIAMPGIIVPVEVTVANNGDFYETFNVTAYYNETHIIGLQEVADLAPSEQQILTYNWDTSGLSLGNYILKANVTIVEEETNTANNELENGSVTLSNSILRNFKIIAGGLTFVVVTNSTSLIPDVDFSSAEKKLGFSVIGKGAGEFCNITIPVKLLGGTYTVLFDGLPATPEPQVTNNVTHTFIYFTFDSNHTVEIKGTEAATPPVAVFTPSKTTALVDEPISFDASDSSDEDGEILAWRWDFDDGSSVNGKNVTHSYAAFRNYTVVLTVEDDDGLTNSTEATIRVIAYPMVKFKYSPAEPLVNETITFDAKASQPNGGSITSYDWNFGDDQKSTGNTTTHSYSITGTFTVNLTVTDSEGLTNSTVQKVTVKIHNIAITNITASSSTVVKGETIEIEITASNIGNFTETFTVTAYYNTTKIETKTVAGVSNGTTQPITIAWNTGSTLPSTYILEARVSVVPKETKTDDNSRTYGIVTIQKITSSINISATSTTITLGKNTIIHGNLDPARPGTTVTVQYRLAEGEWTTLASVTSDAQSRYIINWTPDEPGTYEVQANWKGDINTKPCQSSTQTISVQEGGIPQIVLYIGIIAAVIVLAILVIYFIRFRKK
jgi:PKD repeat protein